MLTPKGKKEYANDLREIVIKHYLNGDSERDIVRKVLIQRTGWLKSFESDTL